MCRLLCASFFRMTGSPRFKSSVGPALKTANFVSRAEAEFDVLLLADKNLRYQQNLAGRGLALVELPTNRWPILEPLGVQVAAAVHGARPGSYTIVQGR
jgi:hypothetical protein